MSIFNSKPTDGSLFHHTIKSIAHTSKPKEEIKTMNKYKHFLITGFAEFESKKEAKKFKKELKAYIAGLQEGA